MQFKFWIAKSPIRIFYAGSVSRLHRIKSDEIWHFYLGGSMTVVELDETTRTSKFVTLGQNILEGLALGLFVCYSTVTFLYAFEIRRACTICSSRRDVVWVISEQRSRVQLRWMHGFKL